MAEVIQKEFDEWAESSFTCDCKILEISGNTVEFSIGECRVEKFSLTFPVDYPNTKSRFVVTSNVPALEEWLDQVTFLY